jgi:RNA polymerase sigma-70 factor (ECF subfamily)
MVGRGDADSDDTSDETRVGLTVQGTGRRKVASVSDLARVLPWASDEGELVTELQGGSEAAFDWLVTHYHAAVYNLVSGMLGDAGDAADVTQEVFLKAFRGMRGFRRSSSLKTWLYRIAIREALNQRRWWWRHHRQQTSIEAGVGATQAPLDLEDLSATPFDQLAAREIQAVVRQALRAVPEVFRSAVILRDLEGLSYEEVAEVVDVSVGTVKSRILRGRRALREVLEPLLAPARRPAPREVTPARQPAYSAGAEVKAYGRRTVGVSHGAMRAGTFGGGAR